MTLTSNPFPDPQVLLAAGLSDLAALAAPDGPSEAKPAVRAPMASRKKPALERPSAFEERRRDGAATMPPPKVVSKFEPPRRLSSAARQTPIACVDATPTHDAVGRKRPVATPPTDLVSLGAELSPTAANDGASAVAAAALATPNDSDASGRTTRRFAGARSNAQTRDEDEKETRANAPAETNVPSPVTVVANARRAELLSPATAAAVETLAGVGATAARARSAGAENEDAAIDFSFSASALEDGGRGLSGSEALYSKFAAAAMEPPDKHAPANAVFPSAFAARECRAPSVPEKRAFSRGATEVPRKKRRTLSEAVEQFQFETEKAAAEEMLAMRGDPLGSFGVNLAFSAPNGTPEEAEKVGAAALFAALAPPPKKRKPRRWLSEDEKVFTCGIDGCARSYGSASSLCAHKRAHHPDWKERRDQQRRAEAEAAAARGEEADDAEKDDENENDDENDDEDDVAGRQARKEGSKALDASARLTPSGAWIESLAADAHARLGALRRSRQRVQRGVRDARAATSALTDAQASPEPSAAAVAAAAATRLLQNMETALEAEADQLSAWLEKIERVAELRQNAGRALFAAEEDEALLGEGFAAAAAAMGPLEAREAARTAREARAALAGSAAAFGAGGKKKEKKEKPADRG